MLWLWLTTHAFAADLLVDVGDDWCATLSSAVAGDRVLLAPGTHTGTCAITPAGEEGNPVIFSVQDTERRAILSSTGVGINLLDLYGGELVVEGIDFGPTEINAEAIRLHAGDRVTIRDCSFDHIGGQAIVANTAGSTYSDILIEDSTFTDLTASAITVGCFAGSADCSASSVVVQRNRIDGAASGSGIVFERDAVGHIAHNTVSGTLGPAVRVGGDAADGGGVEAPAAGELPSTVVEGNHLSGSATDATLTVDGGPVLVRNNVVLSGTLGALVVTDPSATDRMDHIHVLGNSLAGGSGPVVSLDGWSETATLSFQVNGVWDPTSPGAGVPSPIGALPWAGNADCSSETACFEDITAGDPSPRAGGDLVGVGIEVADGLLPVDLCGDSRAVGDPAGALVSSLADPMSLTADTDPTQHCTTSGPDDTGIDDTGIEDTAGPGPRPGTGPDNRVPGTVDTAAPALPSWSAAWKAGETGGVSCSTAGVAASWSALLIGLFAAARRRQDR